MSKNMMYVAIVVALAVGFVIGNRYEKSKLGPQMTALQTQLDELKKKEEAAMMSKENMMGVTMKDGKMMTIWKGGDTAKMEKDETLNDGTKVMMDGKVVKPDGTSMMMKEGEKLGVDGKMMQ